MTGLNASVVTLEGRFTPRTVASFPISAGRVRGVTVNLNDSGLSFKTEGKIDCYEAPVAITLPSEPVRAKIKIVWMRPAGAGGGYY